MERGWGVVGLLAVGFAALCFLVAGANIDVAGWDTSRKIAWGLFALAVSILCGYGGFIFKRLP